MSTDISEKEIQNKIKLFVSKLDSDDKVDPKSHTSFLLSMLEENMSLTFQLPHVIDIDLRNTSFKRSAFERFFDMDGQGVRKINLSLDQNNRLNVLQNTKIISLDELNIIKGYWSTWSRKDNEDLRGAIIKTNPKLLSFTRCEWKLLEEATINVILQHVSNLVLNKCDFDNEHLLMVLKTSHNLKVLKVRERGTRIDGEVIEAVGKLSSDIKIDLSGEEITLIHKSATMKSLTVCHIKIHRNIAEALSRLPDNTQLDLSGNWVTDKSACATLIHKAATMKSLNICNCGIQIDTQIAEAVSRLPDNTQLDLSGNWVKDKSACITLIHKAATMKSLRICYCGIQIDTEIADAVSRLPDHTELDLSGNWVTDKSACATLIYKAATMKSLSVCNCGIKIDTEIAEAVSRLPDHTQLDFSGNWVTDKSACIALINKAAKMKYLKIHNCMYNCGIQIDTDIARAVSRLPDHMELDLSGNQVTDKSACIALIHKAATMQSLNIHNCMSNCGIEIDTEIAEAVSRLPDHTQLDLSGNHVTDTSACITLIHKAAKMKYLKIHNCMYNCGIQIDTDIARAVSRLPDHMELDLSGNQVTDKSACIALIHKAATMKSLNIHNCMYNSGIEIDTEIAEAVSRLPDYTQLDLSGNNVTDTSVCITLIHKAATMKSLSICNCGIQIDTEIAEAVSSLPDNTQLDLSGNQVTDKSVYITLLHKAANMKSLSLCNCGIKIDAEIAEVVSRLPDDTQLDLSSNQLTDKSVCITLISKCETMKSLNIHDCMSNCGIKIDTEIAEAVSRLPDHTELDLSGNQVMDKSVCITLIGKCETMKSLDIHDCMSNCGIKIDTEIAEAISKLPDHTELDLSGNQVTDKSACITLIHKAATMKSLIMPKCMSNFGIQIDTDIAKAISRLPDHTELDLSGNWVTNKSACFIIIHKAAYMKSLKIHNCMYNCGIKIDTDIAVAVSRLPDDIQLDLSGNKLTKMYPRLLAGILVHMPEEKEIDMTEWEITIDVDIVRALSKMHQLKTLKTSSNKLTPEAAKEIFMSKLQKLDLSNCGIKIDTEIAEAVSSFPDDIQLDLSGNQVTDKSACITLIHKAATMKSLSIHNCMSNCGIKIDTEIAEAVSRLPDDIQLDLSGNQVTDKSACIILIHKAATMKSLNIHNCMYNCGIQINTEIAEAVSRLPDDTQLDLSGNQITDNSACITLIHKAATMKSLSICNCGIQIDSEIAEAVSRLPDHTQLDLSGNQVTDKSVCITLIHKAANMKSLHLCNCGIQINREIAEAVFRLPDHAQLDLYGNQVTDKSACITLLHKVAIMNSLNIQDCISNCGIKIDTDIAEAVSRLPDHTQLDLSGNQVTDKSVCVTLIHKAANMKSLNIHDCISNCGIQIDTEIAEAVSKLPDHTQLDLSGNQVTDKSACITLIHKAVTMKSLSMHNCMSNCGIQIDTEIAEALTRLSDNIQLDLSGNELTTIEPRLLPCVLTHIPEDEEINMTGWGITIDVDIVKALSKMPQLKLLKASCNILTPEAARAFSMSQVQQLYLCECGISNTVCVSLMNNLSKYCPLLEILDLGGNNLTSDVWCRHVQMKKLRKLYLFNCGINNTVCESLVMSLYTQCPLLEVLDIGGYNLTSDELCHVKMIGVIMSR